MGQDNSFGGDEVDFSVKEPDKALRYYRQKFKEATDTDTRSKALSSILVTCMAKYISPIVVFIDTFNDEPELQHILAGMMASGVLVTSFDSSEGVLRAYNEFEYYFDMHLKQLHENK